MYSVGAEAHSTAQNRAHSHPCTAPRHTPYPPIETERLGLRAFAADDLEALFALHSDPDLVRWIPWGPRSREEVRAVLGRKMDCTTFEREGDGLGFAVCLRETGELIGDFTLQYESETYAVGRDRLHAARRPAGPGLRPGGRSRRS